MGRKILVGRGRSRSGAKWEVNNVLQHNLKGVFPLSTRQGGVKVNKKDFKRSNARVIVTVWVAQNKEYLTYHRIILYSVLCSANTRHDPAINGFYNTIY